MKGLFVDPKETLEISFFIGTGGDGSLFAVSEEKEFSDKEFKDKNITDVQKHNVIFRRPSYSDNVDILSLTLKTKGEEIVLDPTLLRYERFCALAKEWSLVNEKNEPIELNRKNINNLEPDIANIINNKLEAALGSF